MKRVTESSQRVIILIKSPLRSSFALSCNWDIYVRESVREEEEEQEESWIDSIVL